MDNVSADILQSVTAKTNSELILFFVILAVVAIVVFVPIYTVSSKNKKKQQDSAVEREKQIIHTISENSTAIASLKTLLESSYSTTTAALTKMQGQFVEVKKRINIHSEDSIKSLTKMETTLDEIIRRQATNYDETRRILTAITGKSI